VPHAASRRRSVQLPSAWYVRSVLLLGFTSAPPFLPMPSSLARVAASLISSTPSNQSAVGLVQKLAIVLAQAVSCSLRADRDRLCSCIVFFSRLLLIMRSAGDGCLVVVERFISDPLRRSRRTNEF